MYTSGEVLSLSLSSSLVSCRGFPVRSDRQVKRSFQNDTPAAAGAEHVSPATHQRFSLSLPLLRPACVAATDEL